MNENHRINLFIECLKEQKIFFLIGSGISCGYPACLPSAYEILKFTANLVLPENENENIEKILEIIQPEIFYEKLMILIGDHALEPWRVLENYKNHQVKSGYPLGPTLAHFLITYYSAKSSVPIITTNFDTLFEEASKLLGLKYTQVNLYEPKQVINNDIEIWKVHGSIDIEDKDGRLNILTTMARITQPNMDFIIKLRQLMQKKHLCLIAYSGRDIDLFPFIAGMEDTKAPFWINTSFQNSPKNEFQLMLYERALRIKAATIGQSLDKVIQKSYPVLFNEISKEGVDLNKLLINNSRTIESKLLRSKMISEHQSRLKNIFNISEDIKRLFFCICLNIVGLPNEGYKYIKEKCYNLSNTLSDEKKILFRLTKARNQDLISNYDDSLKEAKHSLRYIRRLLITSGITLERINLMVQALHQDAMARKLQAGPTFEYGIETIDTKPSLASLVFISSKYFFNMIKIRILLSFAAYLNYNNIKYLIQIPQSDSNIYLLNSWYWYLDHKIIFFAILDHLQSYNLLKGSKFFKLFLKNILNNLMKQASTVGDSFALGNINKYLYKLLIDHSIKDDAISVYSLITNPLNIALLNRTSGDQNLKKGNNEEAKKEFKKCYNLAEQCGSHATMLKAVIGLYACGSPIYRSDMLKLKQNITGRGYQKYINRIIQRVKLQ